jgi:dipeptidase
MTTLGWLVLALVVLLCWQVSQVCGCFAVVVGRAASSDGSVLVGHTEENYGEHVVDFRRIASRRHEPGATVELRRGGTLEQVPQTLGFLWSENLGLEYSDAYLNDRGVAIVSDGCFSREDDYGTLVARGEIRQGGIGYMLRRLVAERAPSAREGVELAGRLVERFGYAESGRTYVIADGGEAWLVALVRGRQWAAQRVPDDAVAVVPNVYVLGQLDLKDAANVRASADLVEYAAGRGWFDRAAAAPFDFRQAYQAAEHNDPDPRQWWGQQLVAGTSKDFLKDVRNLQDFARVAAAMEPLPCFVKPPRRLGVADLAAILRNDEGPRSLFHPAAQETAIFQLRGGMPAELGCVYWRTTGRPDTSVLTPWYAGITQTPPAYSRPAYSQRQLPLEDHFNPPPGTFDPDPALAWWKFKAMQDLVDQDYAARCEVVRPVWAAFESRLLAAAPGFEGRTLELWRSDREAARAELTRYCALQAEAACAEADRLARQLTCPCRP